MSPKWLRYNISGELKSGHHQLLHGKGPKIMGEIFDLAIPNNIQPINQVSQPKPLYGSFPISHPGSSYLRTVKEYFCRRMKFRFCMQRWDPSIPPYNMAVERFIATKYPRSRFTFHGKQDFYVPLMNSVKEDTMRIPEIAVIGEASCGKGAFIWSLLRLKSELKTTLLNASYTNRSTLSTDPRIPFCRGQLHI